ncbi:HAD-IA family hydrolase [Streptomyces sp. NPDC127172]|uniref:HAD-IA family hydrolase n=1 Tax=Streptomyces sp. NPDC127172 TaxID=3345382 RepID=UPI0036273871
MGFVEGENRQTPRCIVLSRTARRALDAEWDRCRWLWNECVAKSRHVHAQSRAGGEKLTCGPAQLGVVEALDQIQLPTCVASSSTHSGLRHTPGLTGLYARFEGRIYSAAEVTHGKPAPDLFLHAARHMGFDPEVCAVVEDSRYGVQAARAAGMRVFGYCGGLTPAQWRNGPDTVVFDDMRKLPALLTRT